MPHRSPDSPLLAAPPALFPDFATEREWLARGARTIAGVDEAGRGPLAGPVVAAAVILDAANVPAGLNDSKKLSAPQRERVFAAILASATIGAGSASAAEIDRLNIRQATFLAMRRAVAALAADPDRLLIDGNDVPPDLASHSTWLVGGDARSLSIAAASIVAKVLRDRMMARLGAAYPAYGFERHMGYGTKAHRDAILRHSPTPHHRLTFAPLKHANAAGAGPAA